MNELNQKLIDLEKRHGELVEEYQDLEKKRNSVIANMAKVEGQIELLRKLISENGESKNSERKTKKKKKD